MLHILPNGFVKIRYYGFFCSRSKKKCLRECMYLLGSKQIGNTTEMPCCQKLLEQIMGIDPLKCPCCGKGKMILVGSFSGAEKVPT